MPFDYHSTHPSNDEQIYLQALGDLTIYSVQDDHQKLITIINKAKKLYLDLSLVEEIDTSGMQVLLSLKKWAQNKDIQIYFENPSAAIKKVFNLLSIDINFNTTKVES